MRRLPDSVREEVAAGLNTWGARLASAMRARAPKRTGALQQGISHKVLARSLKLQVGLLGTKRGRSKLFYARILDLGRKRQVRPARRRLKSGAVSSYTINVAPIRAMRFVTGSLRDLRQGLRTHLGDVFDRALKRISEGGE